MAKERLFDLPETKGTFQIRGLVTGHDKDGFYKESKTKTGKTMRRTSFGVTYEPGKTMYVNVQGFPQENVYFSSQSKNGEKPVTEKVSWADRFSFKKEGFRMIGNNIGVTKAVNAKGEYENVKKILTDFDAAKEVADNLKDDDSVFIKGKLEYSSFSTDNGEMHSVKLIPNQVSLCKSPIDFNDEKFESNHQFTQVIVFTGIEQEKEDDPAEYLRQVLGQGQLYLVNAQVDITLDGREEVSEGVVGVRGLVFHLGVSLFRLFGNDVFCCRTLLCGSVCVGSCLRTALEAVDLVLETLVLLVKGVLDLLSGLLSRLGGKEDGDGGSYQYSAEECE